MILILNICVLSIKHFHSVNTTVWGKLPHEIYVGIYIGSVE